MNRNYKIILYLIAFFVLLAAVFAIVTGLFSSKAPQQNQNSNTSQNSTTTPILQLNAQEEKKVREFVKNFVELYYSYGYDDYSNLTALGDYQTQPMQQKTLDTVAGLQQTVEPGFIQTAESDVSSFTYKYSGPDTLTVTIKVKLVRGDAGAINSPRNPQAPNAASSQAVIILKSYNQGWIVDDIEIN